MEGTSVGQAISASVESMATKVGEGFVELLPAMATAVGIAFLIYKAGKLIKGLGKGKVRA